jgi:hypothetical protein
MVQYSAFMVSGAEFRVWFLGLRVEVSWCRLLVAKVRAEGVECRG